MIFIIIFFVLRGGFLVIFFLGLVFYNFMVRNYCIIWGVRGGISFRLRFKVLMVLCIKSWFLEGIKVRNCFGYLVV